MIKKFLLLLLSFVALTAFVPAFADPPGCADWVLTFEDNFDGNALDTTKWYTSFQPSNRRTGAVGGGQLQYYADENISVANGIVTLLGTADSSNPAGVPYKTAMLNSYSKFFQRYGYWEIKAILPRGLGLFPAFWAYSQNSADGYEVDFMENIGGNNIFFNNFLGASSNQGSYSMPGGPFDAWHTYAMDWTPTQITYYVDGVARFTTGKNVPPSPIFLLITYQIGGSWAGAPPSGTFFPNKLLIDYVRVWQRKTDMTVTIPTIAFKVNSVGQIKIQGRLYKYGDTVNIPENQIDATIKDMITKKLLIRQ